MPSSSQHKAAEAPSPWRLVRARVHVALSPQQLSNVTAAATRQAYSNLLLRHNAALGGVIAAHGGPLVLNGAPRMVDASPFAHVSGTTSLLVFAPVPGCILTGVVNHVGPDHVGLSVHAVFHAVLPIDDCISCYQYQHDPSNDERRWRFVSASTAATATANAPATTTGTAIIAQEQGKWQGQGEEQRQRQRQGQEQGQGQVQRPRQGQGRGHGEGRGTHTTEGEADIVRGRHIRFAVTSVKATRSGLFQMLASVDARNSGVSSVDGVDLGVLSADAIPEAEPRENLFGLDTSNAGPWPNNFGNGFADYFGQLPMPRFKRKVDREDPLQRGSKSDDVSNRNKRRSSIGDDGDENSVNADVDIAIGTEGITIKRIKKEGLTVSEVESESRSFDRKKKKKRKTEHMTENERSELGSSRDASVFNGYTHTVRKRTKTGKRRKSGISDLSSQGEGKSENSLFTERKSQSDVANDTHSNTSGKKLPQKPATGEGHDKRPSSMLVDAVKAVEVGLALSTANCQSKSRGRVKLEGEEISFPTEASSHSIGRSEGDSGAANEKLNATQEEHNGSKVENVESNFDEVSKSSAAAKSGKRKRSISDAGDHGTDKKTKRRRQKENTIKRRRASTSAAEPNSQHSFGPASMLASAISRSVEESLHRRKFSKDVNPDPDI